MQSAITVGYRQAWLEGAAREGITLDELTDQERQALRGAINEDFQYILGFTLAIEAAAHVNEKTELASLYSRGELWINRYNAVKAQADAMARADQKKKFVLGPTEKHCPTCSGFDGRVYRNSVWKANGALPGSRRYQCGGYRCECALKDTTERCTPGRFPVGLLKAA